MQFDNDGNMLYKVIVVGESGVGKTSLLSQYCYNRFGNQKATIAIDFATTMVKSSDGLTEIKLQI